MDEEVFAPVAMSPENKNLWCVNEIIQLLSTSKQMPGSLIPEDFLDEILEMIAYYAVHFCHLPIEVSMIISKNPPKDYSQQYSVENALTKGNNCAWCSGNIGITHVDLWIDFGRTLCFHSFTLAAPINWYTQPVKIGVLYVFKKFPLPIFQQLEGNIAFQEIDDMLKELIPPEENDNDNGIEPESCSETENGEKDWKKDVEMGGYGLHQDKFRDENVCVAVVDLRNRSEATVELPQEAYGQWVLVKFLSDPNGRDKNVDIRHFSLCGFAI